MLISNHDSRKKYKRKKSTISDDATMLSVKRVADKYGFSIHTVYNWVNRDNLKHVRLGPGAKIIIKQSDAEAFIRKWYEAENEKMGLILIAFPCEWLGCQETLQIDYTSNGRPNCYPEGWQRLVISKGLLPDQVIPAADFDGWLCPKHYGELLSLLKKDELTEQDKNTIHG